MAKTTKAASVGGRVREMRLARGLSQEQLAAKAGLTKDTVGDFERDSFKNPRNRTVACIARALGVSVETLRGGGK